MINKSTLSSILLGVLGWVQNLHANVHREMKRQAGILIYRTAHHSKRKRLICESIRHCFFFPHSVNQDFCLVVGSSVQSAK